MIILVLVEEVDRALGITLGVLDSCGFKTMVVENRELKMISTERTIILGKHPRKRHNGSGKHRRRFALYQYRGFRSIGYAEGADKEIDNLWWRDLFYKLRSLLWNEMEKEQWKLLLPLEKLKELGN